MLLAVYDYIRTRWNISLNHQKYHYAANSSRSCVWLTESNASAKSKYTAIILVVNSVEWPYLAYGFIMQLPLTWSLHTHPGTSVSCTSPKLCPISWAIDVPTWLAILLMSCKQDNSQYWYHTLIACWWWLNVKFDSHTVRGYTILHDLHSNVYRLTSKKHVNHIVYA